MIKALLLLSEKLSSKDISWVIYGGCALALHGLPIETSDIDILTDQEGVKRITQELKEYSRTGIYEFTPGNFISEFTIFGIFFLG